MKIAQLSTRYPPATGGVERHVREISGRLGRRGHTVDVLTSDLLSEFPWQRLPASVPRSERTEFGSIRRLPVRSLPGPLHYPFFRGLDEALRETGADLTHVHTYGTHQLTVAARAHRQRGSRFVLTAHFHPITSIAGGWLRHRLRAYYDRRVGGPFVAEAARLVVQSREEERLVRSLGFPLPPIEIVPPGYTPLPTAVSPEELLRRTGLTGPYFVFLGRLASNKGLVELVQAFAPIARRSPELTLALVGPDGGFAGRVDAMARELGIERQVRRLGFIAEEELVAAALKGARALVLPSEYEAFGLVLLEALGEGTPVIATRVGAVPEFIEDGRAGWLVPAGDVAALTGALEAAWADPALAARLGSFGQEHVVPRFGWETVVDRLEALYRAALAD